MRQCLDVIEVAPKSENGILGHFCGGNLSGIPGEAVEQYWQLLRSRDARSRLAVLAFIRRHLLGLADQDQ